MFGILLWEMFARELPYGDVQAPAQQTASEIAHGVLRPRQLASEQCPQDIWCIMQDCWNQNPDERPTMEQVLQRLQDALKGPAGDFKSNQYGVYLPIRNADASRV